MKAKKLLSIILVSVSAVGLLAGCGSSTESGQTDTADDAVKNETQEDTAQDGVQTDGASGNVLVVYYSATGNTEAVANIIAETTGGDLFELEPTELYSDEDLNWTDDNSRVSQEYADESLRDVELNADTVENWDSYDTVFIGYPKIQYGFLSV